MNRLRDKVALVTGSSRGIGTAIATRFAREGAKVTLHGRDAAALSDFRAGINWDSPFQIILDLTNFREIEDMRRHVERALGPIDILVANASGNTAKPVPVEDTSEQEWRAALDGNLTARALSGIGRCGLGRRNHPRRCGRRGDGVKINNGAAPRCSGSST